MVNKQNISSEILSMSKDSFRVEKSRNELYFKRTIKSREDPFEYDLMHTTMFDLDE